MPVVSVVVTDKNGNVVSANPAFNPALHPDGSHAGLCLYPAADFNPSLPASGRPYTLKTTPPDYADRGDHPGVGNVSRFHVLDVTGGGGVVTAAAAAPTSTATAKSTKKKATTSAPGPKGKARKAKKSARTPKAKARKPGKAARKPAKAARKPRGKARRASKGTRTSRTRRRTTRRP